MRNERKIRILILARCTKFKRKKKLTILKKKIRIFFTFRQLILEMGVFIRFMGSPDCDFKKIAMGEVYFRGT
jgi:hypothetical protein